MRLSSQRLNFPKAKKLCGLDPNFEIQREEDYHFAMRVWRELTVDARRKNDDSRAAELSECKELFKRRHNSRVKRFCPKCGSAKGAFAQHCQLCSLNFRFYSSTLDSIKMKEHEIEEALVLVGPRCHQTGILTGICRKMATTGQVGDSFVTDKQPTSVKNICRMVGMEVTVRIANPEEKDLKKRRWRVWRTDGFEMEAVNERIKTRTAGGAYPPSPPCTPPPPGTVPDRHPKKKKPTSEVPAQSLSESGPRQKRP